MNRSKKCLYGVKKSGSCKRKVGKKRSGPRKSTNKMYCLYGMKIDKSGCKKKVGRKRSVAKRSVAKRSKSGLKRRKSPKRSSRK
jgi:hypothetical protein